MYQPKIRAGCQNSGSWEKGNREIERGPMDQLLGSVAESTTGRGVKVKEAGTMYYCGQRAPRVEELKGSEVETL